MKFVISLSQVLREMYILKIIFLYHILSTKIGKKVLQNTCDRGDSCDTCDSYDSPIERRRIEVVYEKERV
jgi:hypothetical protein